jgi:hypothetical protein
MEDCLPATAVLRNHENLRALCDVVIAEPVPGTDPPGWHLDPALFAPLIDRLPGLADGAILYIRANLIDRFFAEVFPRIGFRFVLVTASGDWNTPGPHAHRLEDPRILRWFGENADLAAPHPKFEPIPLGFTDPRNAHGDQAVLLRLHRRMPPVSEKPAEAHGSFHLLLSHPERRQVWKTVRDLPGVHLEPKRIPPELLWIRHANFAFEVSPRGWGQDCHRTWEALLLRSIPLVMTSPLDPVYAGFPVVILSDWREITPAAMLRWRAQHAGGFTGEMFRRLTIDHWAERICRAADCRAV